MQAYSRNTVTKEQLFILPCFSWSVASCMLVGGKKSFSPAVLKFTFQSDYIAARFHCVKGYKQWGQVNCAAHWDAAKRKLFWTVQRQLCQFLRYCNWGRVTYFELILHFDSFIVFALVGGKETFCPAVLEGSFYFLFVQRDFIVFHEKKKVSLRDGRYLTKRFTIYFCSFAQ